MEEKMMLSNAVDLLKSRGFENIRADVDNFERPARLIQKGKDKNEFTPDLTAKQQDGKFYFEIVRKAKRDKRKLVDKWTLLSTLAQQRNGNLFLLVPHGKLTYTQKILREYHIDAEIIKI